MNRAAITGFVTVALVALAGRTFAGQELGTATPKNPEGKWSVGAGYYYYGAKYKAEDAGELDLSDVSQNMFFADFGYGFAEDWEAYLRVGEADWASLGALPVSPRGDVEAGYRPYFGLGLRGSIFREDRFAVGFVGQYSYFSRYEVTETGQTGIDDVWPYEATVNFRDLYDLNLGINFDFVPDWGAVYVGWFWYKGAGKAEVSIEVGDDPADTYASDIEENGYMGGFGGLRFEIDGGWNITVEGQYKTRASASVSLSKVFGL